MAGVASGTLPEIRRERMLATIRSRSFARVAELSSEFGISEVTVRSDLDVLERLGAVSTRSRRRDPRCPPCTDRAIVRGRSRDVGRREGGDCLGRRRNRWVRRHRHLRCGHHVLGSCGCSRCSDRTRGRRDHHERPQHRPRIRAGHATFHGCGCGRHAAAAPTLARRPVRGIGAGASERGSHVPWMQRHRRRTRRHQREPPRGDHEAADDELGAPDHRRRRRFEGGACRVRRGSAASTTSVC